MNSVVGVVDNLFILIGRRHQPPSMRTLGHTHAYIRLKEDNNINIYEHSIIFMQFLLKTGDVLQESLLYKYLGLAFISNLILYLHRYRNALSSELLGQFFMHYTNTYSSIIKNIIIITIKDGIIISTMFTRLLHYYFFSLITYGTVLVAKCLIVSLTHIRIIYYSKTFMCQDRLQRPGCIRVSAQQPRRALRHLKIGIFIPNILKQHHIL